MILMRLEIFLNMQASLHIPFDNTAPTPQKAKLVMRVQKELLLLLHVCNKQSPTQIQAVYKSLPIISNSMISRRSERDIKSNSPWLLHARLFAAAESPRAHLLFPKLQNQNLRRMMMMMKKKKKKSLYP
jgi:hypothetical protein